MRDFTVPYRHTVPLCRSTPASDACLLFWNCFCPQGVCVFVFALKSINKYSHKWTLNNQLNTFYSFLAAISYIPVRVGYLSYYLSPKQSQGQGLITKITHKCTGLNPSKYVGIQLVFPGNSYTFVWEQHCKNSLQYCYNYPYQLKTWLYNTQNSFAATVSLISNLTLACTELRESIHFSIKTRIFSEFTCVFRMLHVHTQDCSSSLRVYTRAYTWVSPCTWEYFSSSSSSLQIYTQAFTCRPFDYSHGITTHLSPNPQWKTREDISITSNLGHAIAACHSLIKTKMVLKY